VSPAHSRSVKGGAWGLTDCIVASCSCSFAVSADTINHFHIFSDEDFKLAFDKEKTKSADGISITIKQVIGVVVTIKCARLLCVDCAGTFLRWLACLKSESLTTFIYLSCTASLSL
jgi:hypothetical protein